ncbi:DUF4387 family protein [Pseudomonas sp. NPDC086278]|uniref:DUF4387 family protein n=1 Tax=Pseudomonas sp. NPDC086278 TaxID=3390646 RepID=UPI003CFEA89C
MGKVIYRVVSACGALGYGFPKESLDKALEGGLDAIVSDAGSMDAGPYYLGTGKQYFEREAVKQDFRHMAQAGQKIAGPVILGSCGMAGGDKNLQWMLDVAKEVFEELGISGVKVATISSELDPEIVIKEFKAGKLLPTGDGPTLNEQALRNSTIVGQLGIHPLMCAIEAGAKYIFAGRACDVALFAADMILKKIDPGLAYHVGHVLECGALACTPGSPSDCLIAEIYDDNSAIFIAPNQERRCTADSIAAHSLYEESHPQLQYYPEGVLAMEGTEFFTNDAFTAGIRGSQFVHAGKPWPLSIKLEGSTRVGARRVSLLHIDPAALSRIPDDVMVYGRNGVQARHVEEGEAELGIIIETTADSADAAIELASLLTHYLVHYGYPGRKATAGNIAYPISPNLISFRRADGSFGAVVPSGTRDPVFFKNYDMIKKAVIKLITEEFPDALTNAAFTIVDATASAPVVLIRTTGQNAESITADHDAQVAAIRTVADIGEASLINLDTDDAYEWSLYHLFTNEDFIKQQLFPIHYFLAEGSHWSPAGEDRARYTDIGIKNYAGLIDERKLSVIAEVAVPPGADKNVKLMDIASVIRSKDAGINRLTFDIIFNDHQAFDRALRSNAFSPPAIAGTLRLDEKNVVGTFAVHSCNAIKITIDRPIISGSMNERDVFGAQQQSEIERMSIS